MGSEAELLKQLMRGMRNPNRRLLILISGTALNGEQLLAHGAHIHERGVSAAQQSRVKAHFLCQPHQSVGCCPLRFLGFDAGGLAGSVPCPPCFPGAVCSLERSRMTTFCTR